MNISNTIFYIIDGLIALIYLFFIVKSFKNGFLYELLNLVYFLISVLVSWFVAPIFGSKMGFVDITSKVNSLIDVSSINLMLNTIIWFVIIVLVLNILYLIIKPLIKKISKVPVIGFANQILGVLIGLLNATLITILISLLLALPIFKNGTEIKQGTVLKYTDTITKKVTEIVVSHIDLNKLKDEVNDFDVDKERELILKWLIEQGVLDE